MSNDFWINSFDHFWTQRNRWAEAIKNPKSDYQLYEDRAVRKDSVAYWLCKHPVTQEKLLERDGHLLIVEALETFSAEKWNTKDQGSYESTAYETRFFNETGHNNLYIKIAVKDNVTMLDRKGVSIVDCRIKIVSFHPQNY